MLLPPCNRTQPQVCIEPISWSDSDESNSICPSSPRPPVKHIRVRPPATTIVDEIVSSDGDIPDIPDIMQVSRGCPESATVPVNAPEIKIQAGVFLAGLVSAKTGDALSRPRYSPVLQ